MIVESLLREKRNEILKIAKKYGASNVRVFRSVARGDALDASDIDFLAELEAGRSLVDLGGLQTELETILVAPCERCDGKNILNSAFGVECRVRR